MTWEEMMAPFFGVVVEPDTDEKKILVGKMVPAGGA